MYFIFVNFENARKNIMKSANFFVFVLNCTKRRCTQIKPQFKVEIEDVLRHFFSSASIH